MTRALPVVDVCSLDTRLPLTIAGQTGAAL
jgi:hypothetical protein